MMPDVQDVTTLPAGRELDVLVRDTLFGPWDESRCRVCGWKIVPDGEQGCWRDNCSMRFPDGMYPPRADEPRPYSTDISAAWEIVQKLHEDATTYFQIEWSRSKWEAIIRTTRYGTWSAEGGESDGYRGEAYGATAPLAICRAALKAVSLSNAAATPHEDPK